MSVPKKCANMACTCPAPANKKYCSDHCENIGNKMEIICQCSHPVCSGEEEPESKDAQK